MSIAAHELRAHFPRRIDRLRRRRLTGDRYDVCACGSLIDEHIDADNRRRTCEELQAVRAAERISRHGA